MKMWENFFKKINKLNQGSMMPLLKNKCEILVPIELSILLISLSAFTNWSIFKTFAFLATFFHSIYIF